MPVSTTIEERLFKVTRELGYTPDDFCFALGLKSPEKLKKVLLGQAKADITLIIKTLETFTGLSSEWLLRGSGSMWHVDLDATGNVGGMVTTVVDLKNVPLIPILNQKVAAGYPANYQNPNFFLNLPYISHPHYTEGGFYCLQVSGDSMHPTLFNNDYVIAQKHHRSATDLTESMLYVIVSADGLQVKRLSKVDVINERFYFKSDNKSYPSFWINFNDVIELWQVKSRISSHFIDESEMLHNKLSELEKVIATLKQPINQII